MLTLILTAANPRRRDRAQERGEKKVKENKQSGMRSIDIESEEPAAPPPPETAETNHKNLKKLGGRTREQTASGTQASTDTEYIQRQQAATRNSAHSGARQ